MKYIQSSKNPVVKQWKKLLTKKGRDQSLTYIVEGFHLVEEALKQDDTVMELIFVEGVEVPHKWNLDGVELIQVSQEAGKELADTETTQGVFAVCRQKNRASIEESKNLFTARWASGSGKYRYHYPYGRSFRYRCNHPWERNR